jgi:hypothetical protein
MKYIRRSDRYKQNDGSSEIYQKIRPKNMLLQIDNNPIWLPKLNIFGSAGAKCYI